MLSAGVITASDKGSKGEREDISGSIINEMLKNKGYEVVKRSVLPDDRQLLATEIISMCDELKVNLIITTGGTGFSPRDITPEATKDVLEREVPGICEAIRAHSMTITKRAMLSRGISGIRKNTLIVNLPGSPKAVNESLDYIIDTIEHGLEILTGQTGECGRT